MSIKKNAKSVVTRIKTVGSILMCFPVYLAFENRLSWSVAFLIIGTGAVVFVSAEGVEKLF